MMESDPLAGDFCRFCRAEASSDRPLYHPCICTGSIKWIHQECLEQWIRYSRKEFCELCGHRFSFMPIYSPDMPRRLPLKDVVGGLLTSVATAVKDWLHYTLVALAWLGIVPLTACRTYRSLFTYSLEPILSLPFDIISTENLAKDVFSGCFVVTCTLFSFIGLVWLREQIMHGGGPDWLERDVAPVVQVDDLPRNNNNVPIHQLPPANEGGEIIYEQGNDYIAPVDHAPNGGFNEGINQPVRVRHHRDVDPEPDLAEDPIAVDPGPDVAEDPLAVDQANWNPMEWDRAAEELTWARLLGLDGSMVFLEHVFWVVSLNTLCILVFAWNPYHLGWLAAATIGIKPDGAFSGLITTLAGYAFAGTILVLLHAFAAVLKLRAVRRVLGLSYVVVKVALLSVVEIGVLPLICGWWLDICSLAMFDATLKDREASLQAAPWTLMFIHWLVGMVYVYYFASFILLLREVLRPGVLWFLKNLNDPDYSPVQEMIHLPVLSHIHRLLASVVIFGTAVLFMLWLPIRLLKGFLPGFLPYAVAVHTEAPVSELSLELLLLQVILPALLEQSHSRTWLKALLRAWCIGASKLLGIRSYLLGSSTRADPQPPPAAPLPLGAAHQALMRRDGPAGYEPYERPRYFPLRLAALLLLVAISLVLASALTLVVPVWVGRRVMSLWLPKASEGIHELYTAACGTYLCWAVGRGGGLAAGWARRGRHALWDRAALWARVTTRAALAALLLLGLVPLLFGLLLELVLVIPVRVGLEQSPVLFVWQDWALGVLYTKIATALTMMGPDCAMRRAIELAYRDGIMNMHLKFIVCEIAWPVVRWLGLALAVPYVFAHSIAPLALSSPAQRNLLARRVYPALLLAAAAAALLLFQIRQFRKLYEHIKNDKYLVGQRLVNYDHRRHKLQQSQAQPAAT